VKNHLKCWLNIPTLLLITVVLFWCVAVFDVIICCIRWPTTKQGTSDAANEHTKNLSHTGANEDSTNKNRKSEHAHGCTQV
jgi:hypothetical protein